MLTITSNKLLSLSLAMSLYLASFNAWSLGNFSPQVTNLSDGLDPMKAPFHQESGDTVLGRLIVYVPKVPNNPDLVIETRVDGRIVKTKTIPQPPVYPDLVMKWEDSSLVPDWLLPLSDSLQVHDTFIMYNGINGSYRVKMSIDQAGVLTEVELGYQPYCQLDTGMVVGCQSLYEKEYQLSKQQGEDPPLRKGRYYFLISFRLLDDD